MEIHCIWESKEAGETDEDRITQNLHKKRILSNKRDNSFRLPYQADG